MTLPVPALHPEYTRGYIQRISPRMYPQPSPSLSSRPHISSLANKPKLLDQVRYILRFRHYSYQTEKTYIHWIKRFIFFHHKRHPAEMGKGEVEQFLTSLAVDRHVSAATQNQALHALLFLYREVLTQELGWLDNIVPAKHSQRLPTVLTRQDSEGSPWCARWHTVVDS